MSQTLYDKIWNDHVVHKQNDGTTDLGTLIGLLAGISIIILGILSAGGEIAWFWNFNSILIQFSF